MNLGKTQFSPQHGGGAHKGQTEALVGGDCREKQWVHGGMGGPRGYRVAPAASSGP